MALHTYGMQRHFFAEKCLQTGEQKMKIGSMSIVGVEQKEEPKKRSSVERHITPFIRRHEAQ